MGRHSVSGLRVHPDPIAVVEHRGWPEPVDRSRGGWWLVDGGRKAHHYSPASARSACGQWLTMSKVVRAVTATPGETCQRCERAARRHRDQVDGA